MLSRAWCGAMAASQGCEWTGGTGQRRAMGCGGSWAPARQFVSRVAVVFVGRLDADYRVGRETYFRRDLDFGMSGSGSREDVDEGIPGLTVG